MEPSQTDFVDVIRLTPFASLPTRASQFSAGLDLCSAYNYNVAPMSRLLIKTDLQIKIPKGHYGRIAPRSGLALKNFIDVGAGVIDSDYTGNVGVVLFNFAHSYFHIRRGDKIAQLILELLM